MRAVVAIHCLGPAGLAGGGCRMLPYASDQEALRDALRLSRAMSYKLALFEMPAGGAKMVVMADPRRDKNDKLLRAIGRAVERLGGKYVVAEDVGTTPADMEVIARETSYVVRRRGDTAPATGHGVFTGLTAAVRRKLGRESLRGLRVAIQGAGNVGYHLGRLLAREGAELCVADIDSKAVTRMVDELGAIEVSTDDIYSVDVDVFAPCALGAVLDDATIPRLRCRVIAGGANNQLAEDRHAALLAGRGILYAPDFVLNAGGILGAAAEVADFGSGAAERGVSFDDAKLFEETKRIGSLLEHIFDRAEERGVTPYAAAVDLARERIRLARVAR